MNWYLEVFRKYGVFEGRARRTEYWMFYVFNILISIGLIILDYFSGLTKAAGGLSPLSTLYAFAIILPGFGVTVRRLHDTGHSGWAILICMIPVIGAIIFLVWLVRDSDPGDNKYGPNPKETNA